MEKIDKYNLCQLSEEYLMEQLKDAVIEEIVNNLLSEFKEKAEQAVKAEVEKLSINQIKTFRDAVKMRDEVKIYCEWKA